MINLIGYNITWFGLIYWGNMFIPFSLLMLMAHLRFFSSNKRELRLIAVVTLVGIAVDSLLQYFGVYIFINSSHIPFWLMMLWSCFAATLCHSLGFLAKSITLKITIGGLFAPLSYLAGYKFQVVDFGYSLITTYCLLSVIWAMLFVLFFYLKDVLITTESTQKTNKLEINNG